MCPFGYLGVWNNTENYFFIHFIVRLIWTIIVEHLIEILYENL